MLDAAREILKSCKIPYEEKVERVLPVGDKLVTGYIVFTKGVNARTDLAHYSDPSAGNLHTWTAGRVYLEIIALPLDAKRSQISIVAHFQGRTGGIMTGGKEEWVDIPSNRSLEDEVLRGLAGKILGLDLSIFEQKTTISASHLCCCLGSLLVHHQVFPQKVDLVLDHPCTHVRAVEVEMGEGIAFEFPTWCLFCYLTR